MYGGALVIFVTASSRPEAARIAQALVEKRKAACVNIIPSVRSLFWWQNKISSSSEVMLVIKSRESLLPQVIEIVKRIHSYQVPEIIALPVVGGNADYLQWLSDETAENLDD